MNKSELIAFIAGKLATGSNITAAEHVQVENAIVDYIPTINPIVAYGKIGPIDIHVAGASSYTCAFGNLISATRTYISPSPGNLEIVRVIFPNNVLANSDFKVRIFIEGNVSTGSDENNNMYPPIWQKVGNGSGGYYNDRFDLILEDLPASTASIFAHVEILAL